MVKFIVIYLQQFWQYHVSAPLVLPHPLWNTLQAIERYINRSSWIYPAVRVVKRGRNRDIATISSPVERQE